MLLLFCIIKIKCTSLKVEDLLTIIIIIVYVALYYTRVNTTNQVGNIISYHNGPNFQGVYNFRGFCGAA